MKQVKCMFEQQAFVKWRSEQLGILSGPPRHRGMSVRGGCGDLGTNIISDTNSQILAKSEIPRELLSVRGGTWLDDFWGPAVFWNSALSERQPKMGCVTSKNPKCRSGIHPFAFYSWVSWCPHESVVVSDAVSSRCLYTRLGTSLQEKV